MSAGIDAIIALYRELLTGGPVMHDRALNPIPDLVIEPGGILMGNTEAGSTWLGQWNPLGYALVADRELIADAQDDGLSVEDRR